MQAGLSRYTFAALAVGALIGVAITVGTTQLQQASDRPACAETVMRAVSTDQPVRGTYQCFDADEQAGLQSIGVDSDTSFAALVGQTGEYHYLHKTADGGYVYEYDRPRSPHDRVQGALAKLGVPMIASAVSRGDLGAAWRVPNDLPSAWSEVTGASQNERSELFTFYMDGDGKINTVK